MSLNEYGFPQTEWENAKNEATDILIARARKRGMIPYSELVSKITAIQLDAYGTQFAGFLGEISKREDSARRGLLTVIVVHKTGDMQPGPGFFELASELGRDVSDIVKCWIEEFKKVHEYWAKH